MWHETERGDLYVRDNKGSGVPLVFLHAFPFDGRMWEPVGKLLDDKARIIIPDIPGFGASNDMNLSEISMDSYASTILDVLGILGVSSFIPIGCSLGGYIAMSFMENCPERLLGAGLCCTRSRADTDEERSKRKVVAEKVLTSGVEYLLDRVVPRTVSSADDTQKILLKSYVTEQFSDGAEAALFALASRPDRGETLKKFTGPVLSILGTDDQILNLDEQNEMRTKIKRCRAIDFKGAGHLAPFERPIDAAKAIFSWLIEEVAV